MKEFIFYTSDGFTSDSNNKNVENMQILGFSDGENIQQAFENFKQENKWLDNYSYSEIISQEVSSKKESFIL